MNNTIKHHSSRLNLPALSLALLCFWVPVIIFAKIAGEVLERQPIGADIAILRWFHDLTSPFFDSFFLIFTNAGSAIGIVALTVLISAFLAYRHFYARLTVLLFGVFGAGAANVVLKLLFHRDRPALWHSIIQEHSYSFPSGHAMASSALAASVIVIAWNTRWRIPAIIGGVVFTILVGASRLYFGVHYPTDIIAGWCVSGAWVILVSSIVVDYPLHLHLKARMIIEMSRRHIRQPSSDTKTLD